jgi:hypothetical protein
MPTFIVGQPTTRVGTTMEFFLESARGNKIGRIAAAKVVWDFDNGRRMSRPDVI